MQTLFDKYSQPKDLVYYPFVGSYATGYACLSLPLHRRCIPRDTDVDFNNYEAAC